MMTIHNNRIRSPLNWFGSKSRLALTICKYFPKKHTCFVDVFGGSAAILLASDKSTIEVYNDLDGRLVNFFRVMQDKDKRTEFYEKACLTPYSREVLRECIETIDEGDDVLRCWKFFVVCRMNYNARTDKCHWAKNVYDKTSAPQRYQVSLRLMPNMVKRMLGVQIDNRPALDIIDNYDRPTTLLYLDPPYYPDTRNGGGYHCDMTKHDHEKLIDKILQAKSMVIISGYENELYKKLDNYGWRHETFDVLCYASGHVVEGNNDEHYRQECLWLNPAIQKQLDLENCQLSFI